MAAGQEAGEEMAKRLTQKEIRARAAFKKKLQQEGILPPDKPRLNRKKFIEDTMNQFLDWECPAPLPYLGWALREMMYHRDRSGGYSKEAVGAAKAARLAMERVRFEQEKREAGEQTFTVGELMERVADIYDM